MGRALAILAVAVPVLMGLLTGIGLLAFYDVTAGTPIETWDWAVGGALVAGGAALLAISARAVWRGRGQVAWRVYGGVLAAGAIAGAAAGVWLAGGEILRSDQALAHEVDDLCARFDMPGAQCRDLARRCIAHVSAHAPSLDRGLTQPPPSDPRAPRDATSIAEWQCIGRGGPSTPP